MCIVTSLHLKHLCKISSLKQKVAFFLHVLGYLISLLCLQVQVISNFIVSLADTKAIEILKSE